MPTVNIRPTRDKAQKPACTRNRLLTSLGWQKAVHIIHGASINLLLLLLFLNGSFNNPLYIDFALMSGLMCMHY